MIHVMRVSGHARLSAFTTGSTCTASPSALSITIAIVAGGSICSVACAAFVIRPDLRAVHAILLCALHVVLIVRFSNGSDRSAQAYARALMLSRPNAGGRDRDRSHAP